MERKEYPRPSYLQSGAKLEGGMGGGCPQNTNHLDWQGNQRF